MYVPHFYIPFTSFLFCKEAYYERELVLADRDLVETDSDAILQDAAHVDVSLLVVGDPFG